jgi:hypothetical protein
VEYRILKRDESDGIAGDRLHLAELDRSTSLCGSIRFDGSPFDPWQLLPEDGGPEDAPDGERCATCWERWEIAHREDRERRDLWNPAERTHAIDRRRRRQPSPQVASQKIAAKSRKSTANAAIVDVFRMYRAELETLGTPEALAELKRRRDKRAAKRAERKSWLLAIIS